MDARNLSWYTVNGRSYASERQWLTPVEVLRDTQRYHPNQWRLTERGRVLNPTLVVLVDGQKFDAELL